MRRYVFLFGAVAVALAALPLGGATVMFTDSTFNLSANYSETVTYKSNSSDAVSYSQCANCGNPGQGLQFLANLGANDITAVGFINNTFTYNPTTQGAINAISASVDKNINTNIPVDPTTTFSNTFRPLIEQDGVYFVAAVLGPSFNGGDTGYNTISNTSLHATDFLSFDFTTGTFGSANPNFNGDPMLFGLAQVAQFAGSTQFEGDYDNLSIAVNTAPEPASILLLAAALGALVFTGRMKMRPAKVEVR